MTTTSATTTGAGAIAFRPTTGSTPAVWTIGALTNCAAPTAATSGVRWTGIT